MITKHPKEITVVRCVRELNRVREIINLISSPPSPCRARTGASPWL